MTRAERNEADILLGNGMLAARMQPLLHEALLEIDSLKTANRSLVRDCNRLISDHKRIIHDRDLLKKGVV